MVASDNEEDQVPILRNLNQNSSAKKTIPRPRTGTEVVNEVNRFDDTFERATVQDYDRRQFGEQPGNMTLGSQGAGSMSRERERLLRKQEREKAIRMAEL